MRQAVLDRAADDLFRLDEPICLGDDPSVQAAGSMVGRGTVVLGRLGDGLDLFRREPAMQFLHFPDHPSALQVMRLAVHREAEVMTGGSGVDHVAVHRVVTGKRQRPVHHGTGVVFLMSLIEGGIARDDRCLQESGKRRVRAEQFRRQEGLQAFVGRQPVHGTQFGVCQPTGGLVLVQVKGLALQGAQEAMQREVEGRVVPLDRLQQAADIDLCIQFFPDFPLQRFPGCLSGLHFPAREFPPVLPVAIPALRREDLFPAADDGCYDFNSFHAQWLLKRLLIRRQAIDPGLGSGGRASRRNQRASAISDSWMRISPLFQSA